MAHGIGGIRSAALPEIATRFATASTLPLVLDSTEVAVVEAGLEALGGRSIVNRWASLSEIPAETEESKAMSKELKRRGFRFVGPTICYAFMQATGMVNDHSRDCFRWREVTRRAKGRR